MGERIGEWEVEGEQAWRPSEWAGHIRTTVEVDAADLWVDPPEGALVSVPLPVLAALLRARGWRVEEPGAADPADVADGVAAEWRTRIAEAEYNSGSVAGIAREHYLSGGYEAAEEIAKILRGRKG